MAVLETLAIGTTVLGALGATHNSRKDKQLAKRQKFIDLETANLNAETAKQQRVNDNQYELLSHKNSRRMNSDSGMSKNYDKSLSKEAKEHYTKVNSDSKNEANQRRALDVLQANNT